MTETVQPLEDVGAGLSNDWKPYPAYKDSGAPWLGRVPQGWELRRTKTLLRERVQKGFPDEPMLAATQTKGVVRKEEYENRTVLALKDLHLLKLVRTGDFVISLRSFQGGIEYAREQGIISPAYTVLYPIDASHHGYLAHLFKSKPYIENLTLHVTGIRQGQNIDYEKLSRAPIPLPPPADQDAIVRFPDYQDRLIRTYIRAKQKLIALLTEQKQAIIQRAVTRGLNPDVKLKPSGVDWLGEIPEHWDASRVKNEFHCLNPKRIPLSGTEREKMTSRRYDYYGASGVIDKVDNYLFDGELLLIAEDGANLVLRNLPLAIVARGKFWVNNHAHILKPKRGNLKYLAHVMETVDYSPWISGAAQPKLTKDRLFSIKIPVPPVAEQSDMLAVIEKETTPFRESISRASRQISLMREYRTRLIADVVTGKGDVREMMKDEGGRITEEETSVAGKLGEVADEPEDQAQEAGDA